MFEEKLTVCPSCFSPLRGNESICRDCGANLKNAKKSSAWSSETCHDIMADSNAKISSSRSAPNRVDYKQNNSGYAQKRAASTKNNATSYSQNSAMYRSNASYQRPQSTANTSASKNEQRVNELYANAANNPKLKSAFDTISQNASSQTDKKPRKTLVGSVLFIIILATFGAPLLNGISEIASDIYFELTYEPPNKVFVGDYSLLEPIENQLVIEQDVIDHYDSAQTIYIEQPTWYDESANYTRVSTDSDDSQEYYMINDDNTYIQIAQKNGFEAFMKLPTDAFNEYYSVNFDENVYAAIEIEENIEFRTSLYYNDYYDAQTMFAGILRYIDIYEDDQFYLLEKMELESGAVGYAFIKKDEYDIEYKIYFELGKAENGDVLFAETTLSSREYVYSENGDYVIEFNANEAVDYFKENFYFMIE